MSVVTTEHNTAARPATTQTAVRPAAVTGTDGALLVLRLALAAVFIAHGGQKLFGLFGGPGLAGTVQFMGGMGIPAPLAFLAVFTEFFGGLALIVGAFTRLASLGLFVTMLVATVKVHLANGFFLMTPGGKGVGYEYNMVLLAVTLALVLAGPGRIALGDWEPRLLARLRR
jgi:putative oxidoreductase